MLVVYYKTVERRRQVTVSARFFFLFSFFVVTADLTVLDFDKALRIPDYYFFFVLQMELVGICSKHPDLVHSGSAGFTPLGQVFYSMLFDF
jgi:hypothetical protein